MTDFQVNDSHSDGTTDEVTDLFRGIPLTKLSGFKQEAADFHRRTASMFPGWVIASTKIAFSVFPATPPGAPTYSSFGEPFCLIRFDLDDAGYRYFCTAVREGRVRLSVKTYCYPTYPLIQLVVRIYSPTKPDPWWQETLGDLTDGNIQDFLIDACRLREWKLILSRYDPPGEKILGRMIDPVETTISLSEEQVAHLICEALMATEHFLRIPRPQRDFLRAAQQLTQDNPSIEET